MGLADWWYVFQATRLSKPAENRVLFRATANRKILSVLETGLEDGSRCERLLQWLKHHDSVPARYAAIDQFEAGGGISLKQFHSKLAAFGIKPMPIPGTLATGLPRVAHTIGAVDLLILNQDRDSLCEPAVQNFLPRIIHPETVVIATDSATKHLYAIDPTELLGAATIQSLRTAA
ncbi:hypothetical protein Poly24_49730 [Rosistilla carotiformis]|uniref:Uncharacterized protein n=1 Tax=Rosistilla carotiformis TaxID=2528017 RepID=A0A518K0D3_9BACT|nr:hypothetical protein [Rosistilla carotiformis]QDV71239.1 hypothetical protein Poly24_49730 [Rosistilla carotiformis]